MSDTTLDLATLARKVRLFEGFTPDEVQKIFDIGAQRDFKKGENLFEAGDEGHEMFIMYEGRLEVKTESNVLDTVMGYGVVGEMGMLTNDARSATVCALEPTKTYVIDESKFMQLVEQDKVLGLKFYQNVTRQLCDFLRSNNLLLDFYTVLG